MNKPTQAATQCAVALGKAMGVALTDFDAQCVRILRCTAQALANTPGGLRFKPGTQPWLDQLATPRGAL